MSPCTPLCVYTPFVWQYQPRQKNLGGRIREKPREKHSMALPSRVFHSVFLEYGHLGFFVLVDPATLREYKLLNSYLPMSMYEFDCHGPFCVKKTDPKESN